MHVSGDTVVAMDEWHPVLVALRDGAVLAHEGGWDEIALVAGPLLLLWLLLVLANRRAKRMHEDET